MSTVKEAGAATASTAIDSQSAGAIWAEQLQADWLPTSFALIHARDLLTQVDYGAAIAAAIAKVQTLLEADSASVCLTETAATFQHFGAGEQEITSAARPGGNIAYPPMDRDAVIQRSEPCANCRLLPHVAACASAPLYAEGRQFGMLCAARTAGRPAFDQEQLRLLQVLALCAAIAISNARRMRTAQELHRSQRERIAAHLHDNAAQSLSVIGLKVDRVATALGAALEQETVEQLTAVKTISQQLMGQVRAAFGELRQADPQPDDLVTALAGCIEIFTQAARLPVEFSVAGTCALPVETKTQAVLIVREALNNVARHARAGSVQVKLFADSEKLRILVQDDGVGFDLQAAGQDQRHLGTILMQERAQRSGGSLRVESHPGRGTQVLLTYPAAASSAA